MRSKKTGAPPVPPQRHSSMRTPSITPAIGPAAVNTSNNSNNSYSSQNNSGGNSVVSRLVTDLESKFGKRFHNVTEFPAPPPFLNIQKMYPSRNAVKATNAPPVKPAPMDPPRKPRAPAPPIQAKLNAYAQQQMENQQW